MAKRHFRQTTQVGVPPYGSNRRSLRPPFWGTLLVSSAPLETAKYQFAAEFKGKTVLGRTQGGWSRYIGEGSVCLPVDIVTSKLRRQLLWHGAPRLHANLAEAFMSIYSQRSATIGSTLAARRAGM